MSAIWSHLPRELHIEIFAFGAASSQQLCTSLCIISSWTREIALAQLLHTVIIRSDTQLFKLLDFVSNVLPFRTVSALSERNEKDSIAFSPALLIRRLWLGQSSEHAMYQAIDTSVQEHRVALRKLLSRCLNIRDLAVHISSFVLDLDFDDTINSIEDGHVLTDRPIRLTAYIPCRESSRLVDPTWKLDAAKQSFPQITHLALPAHSNTLKQRPKWITVIRDFQLDQLQMLVITVHVESGDSEYLADHDLGLLSNQESGSVVSSMGNIVGKLWGTVALDNRVRFLERGPTELDECRVWDKDGNGNGKSSWDRALRVVDL